MAKAIWQKIKQNHLLLMVLCCLIPVAIIFGFASFFKGNNYWVWLIILSCPLLHILMMRGHRGDKTYKCPECGFSYEEKEWAEKCEAWCKEHKTCNLEITRRAVKSKNYGHH